MADLFTGWDNILYTRMSAVAATFASRGGWDWVTVAQIVMGCVGASVVTSILKRAYDLGCPAMGG